MINKKILSVIILLGAVAFPMSAKLNLPTKKLGKDNYYYYEVKKNETIFDIANKIGVTKDDIIKYNPSAKNGLVNKQLIFLPVKDFDGSNKNITPQKVNVANLNNVVTHIVKSGESMYGIARAYNVTESELLRVNPDLTSGLKPGSQIIIPQAPANGKYVYHTLVEGESLFSLAKKYNTTIEKLVELNPGISGNNLVENDVIRILPNTEQNVVVDKDIFQFTPYVVAKDDTYQSVAQAHGITVEELMNANPDQKKLKKGKTIYIPHKAVDKQVVSTSQLSETQLEKVYAGKLDDIYSDYLTPNKNNSIDISILLPFFASMDTKPKYARDYEEFYNGFLIALDSIGSTLNKPLNLNVYDTRNNKEITDSLLALDKLKTSDIIIAPSEQDQLEKILNYGKENNIDVLNCFTAKNDSYISNNRVMQVHIPSSYLTARVNECLDKKFKDYVLVYLDDPESDNKDIYDEIKKHASEVKHQNKTLTIASELTGKNLSKYLEPGSSYLFIPANGKESFLKKFVNGLKEAKKLRVDCDLVLFAHPEYTMYINKYKEDLMAIDTYIYSRFYMPDNQQVKDFNAKYKSTFGVAPSNSMPNMSLTGFDLGMFLVKAYAKGIVPGSKDSEYDGIQTNFDFERVNNWAGYINKSVRMVHLSPNKEFTIKDLND